MKLAYWKWLFIGWLGLMFSPVWAQQAVAPVWQVLAPGLEYSRLSGFANFPQGYAQVFRIDLAHYHLIISPLPGDAQQPEAAFHQLMRAEQAVIAVNGGFFTPQLKPLGLRISKGRLINPFKAISWWGVFFIRHNQPQLTLDTNYRPDAGVEFALQAGPPLIIKGVVLPRASSKIDARTAIGITNQGKVILLATENTLLSVAELAELMQRPQRLGGLDCVAAINLDGGHSTQLYTALPGFSLTIASNARVADGVLVVAGASL